MTVSMERRGEVAIVKLDRGVTNALDPDFVNELRHLFGQLRGDLGVRGVVLASASEKFFCIGFDIPRLYELDRQEFRVFFRAFNRACLGLYTLDKPTVAAIGGHATAGGCILALCCDYRFIAEGRNLMGLNEIKLGVPVPYLADCVLRSIVGSRKARDVMEGGEFYPPEASLETGMVDRVLAPGEVLEAAVEWAAELGSAPGPAYELIKRSRVEEVEERVLAHGETRDEIFVDCWYSDEVRERLREAMEKF